MNALKPELEPVPKCMAHLKISSRGYPVPWFVVWLNGEPEFRRADGRKWTAALKERLCWVCGNKIDGLVTFVIGPMCAVNRTTAEPGCHKTCARWSARNCPFLSKPQMVRRDDSDVPGVEPPGIAIMRNPGVTCLWTTDGWQLFDDSAGGKLIHLGAAKAVEWFREGRAATRAEIEESIRTGLPALEKVALEQDHSERRNAATTALKSATGRLRLLLPAV